jgi:hypothetical protein
LLARVTCRWLCHFIRPPGTRLTTIRWITLAVLHGTGYFPFLHVSRLYPYEELRAFDTVIIDGPEEIQHHARIAGKHMRYTIECFDEAIGAPATGLLEPLATLLDTLGELQDEVTARQYLAELGLTGDPGTQAYLASRSDDRAALLAALPDHWEQVVGAVYRGRLLAVLAAL